MIDSIYHLFVSFNESQFRDKDSIFLLHNRNINSAVSKECFSKKFKDLYWDTLQLINHYSKDDYPVLASKDEMIALMAPNSYEWLLTFWATIISGNKIVLLDSNISKDELQHIVTKLDIKKAFTVPELLDRFRGLPSVDVACFHDTKQDLAIKDSFHDVFGDNIVSRNNDDAPEGSKIFSLDFNNYDDDAEIVYLHTSGTTGDSKFVGLTSKNLMAELNSIARFSETSDKDRLLQILPFYHVLGLIAHLFPMSQHISMTLLREINGENIVKAINLTKITGIIAVPALWQLFYNEIFANVQNKSSFFLHLFKWYLAATDPKSSYFKGLWRLIDRILLGPIKKGLGIHLRVFVSGGAKGDYEVASFFERVGIITLEGYGLTESTGPIFFNTVNMNKIGSAGAPLDGVQIQIKNSNGECGEVWVKGPSIFRGYYQQDSDFDDQGYFNTGDLGYLDSDGYLFLSGRKKDLIVLSSGKNVYPDDLEKIYSTSPYFKEIAIVGKKDRYGRESVHAVIVPDLDRLDQSSEIYDLIHNEVLELGKNIPGYRRVSSFTLSDSPLPRTTTRKFKKQEILKNLSKLDAIDWSYKMSDQVDSNLEKNIKKIFKRYLTKLIKEHGWEKVKELDYGNGLGLDSILKTEILYKIENTFHQKVDLRQYACIKNINELIKLLNGTLEVSSTDSCDDTFPAFFDLSEEAIAQRLNVIESKVGTKPSHGMISRNDLRGNIENYIGDTSIPTGVAGPIRIVGEYAKGEFFVPLSTTEGALVASVHRGIQAINHAGGAKVKILLKQMIRTPVFLAENLERAIEFKVWIENNFSKIKNVAERTTNHGKLVEIDPIVFGRRVTLRFLYQTGDAAGQNMCTVATQAACDFIISSKGHLTYFLDNNVSGDKKINAMNFVGARGKRVTAEVSIPCDVVERFFHTTPEEIVDLYKEATVGTILSGGMGFNAHFANIIAAIYTATGQDIASTHESAVGVTHYEVVDNALVASILLPSLITATVGGGTKLPTQSENLAIMQCKGQASEKLAEIIAGAILAGELSIAAAHASNEFTQAHQNLGR